MEEIKTTIEVGGVILESFQTSTAHGCHVCPHGCSRSIYREDMSIVPKSEETVVVGDPVFYIESDDPWKLHRFVGMKYEGLVDRPQDVFKVLDEFVKKFDGCVAVKEALGSGLILVGRKKSHVFKSDDFFQSPLDGQFNWTRAISHGEMRFQFIDASRERSPFATKYAKDYSRDIVKYFTRIMKDEDAT